MRKGALQLMLLMLLSMGSIFAYGQTNRTISGIVRDSTGTGLAGVTVNVKGTKTNSTTDVDGKFTIVLPVSKSTLVISSVGFQSQEVDASTGATVSITLKGESTSLSDVVVSTSFGIKKQNKNLGYAVTTVSGAELASTNTVNPITALQGKVAGAEINVVNTSGVQTSPYIQLRGAAVLGGNNQPIFVIDGNIIQNNLSSPDGSDPGSQLKDLNPDDYESITVLKGAAATALYGSRGINGAIVINTKSGKANKGLGVEYNYTWSKDDLYAPFMALQNQYGMGGYYNNEGDFNPDGTQTYDTHSFGPKFDGTRHPAVNSYYGDTSTVPYVAQPNNWKTFYQNGGYINNSIAIGGATDKTNYRIGYSNNHTDGDLPKNALDRNSFDVKVGGQLNSVFSTEVGINYSNTKTYNYYNQSRYSYGGGGNLGFNVYYMPRNTDFATWHATYRNADNSIKESNFQKNTGIGWMESAFSNLDKNNYENSENSLLAYLAVKAQVNTWIDLNARANINYLSQNNITQDYGNGAGNAGGQYAVGGSNTTNYDFLFTAHGVKKAMNKDLTIDLRLLNEVYGNRYGISYYSTTNGGLLIPNQFSLGNSLYAPTTSNISVTPGYANTLNVGVAGDLNLNYKSYLNVELTGRNDWISQLTYPVGVAGADNYSIFYPSVNVAYTFYDEFRDKMPSWLSDGRLRGSLAYVGNGGNLNPYQTGLGYIPGTVIAGNGGTVTTASVQNQGVLPNPNLKPQLQRAYEFGGFFAFFHNLASIDFAWYKRITFNQSLNLPGVMDTGANQLLINAGNVQNQGIELLLTFAALRERDYGLDISINAGHNAGKIVKLYPNIPVYSNGGFYEGAEVNSYPGGAFGQLEVKGNTAFKIDPKTGFPVINAPSSSLSPYDQAMGYNYQYYSSDTLINMGKVEPSFTSGISLSFHYKNWSLFTQIDGRFGGMTYSESYTYAMSQGSPLASLQFRDQAHGGVARTDTYTGKTVYDGAIPNVVFGAGQFSPITGASIAGMTFREAYNQHLVLPWQAGAYYDGGPGVNGTYDWENGLNHNGSVAKDTWIMFRQVSLAYHVPPVIVSKTKVFRDARLIFTVNNLGYLYKTLPGGQNPASLTSNDPNYPYITGGSPFARNYSISLNVKL